MIKRLKTVILLNVLLGLLKCCSGLQANLEYFYHYTGSITTGIPQIDSQVSRVQLSCDVAVEVHENQYFQVELSNIKSGYLNGKPQPHCDSRDDSMYDGIEMVDGLKELQLPFTVYMKEVDGVKMKVPESDLVWVTNVRKGIISMLQVKPVINPAEYGTAASFSVFEETIHGFCQSRYFLQPLPLFEANLEDHHIEQDVQENIKRSAAIKSSKKRKFSSKKTSGRGRKTSKSSKIQKSKANYKDSSIPSLNDALWSLERVINFDHCHKKITLQDVTMGFKEDVGGGLTGNIASRSSVSHYLLRGDSTGFRVEHVYQEGGLTVNPLTITTEKIIAETNQTLTLKSVTKSDNHITITSTMRDVKTLYYEVMSPFTKTPEIDEDWIHYLNQDPKVAAVYPEMILLGKVLTYDQQVKIKDDILAILKTIAKFLLDPPHPDHEKAILDMMQAAAFNTFYLSKPLLHDLFDEIYAEDTPATPLLEMLVTDLIASGGSGPAVRVLLEKFDQGKISDWRLVSVFMTLTNALYDVTVVQDLMEFVMKRKLVDSPIVNSNFLVNFATLANEVCLDPKAEERVGGPIFAVQKCHPETIIEEFIPYLERNLLDSAMPWEMSIIVQALVNLQSPHTLRILESVIHNEFSVNSVVVRINALKGFREDNLPITARETAMTFLNEVFYNISEIVEVRQEALIALVSWKPDAAWWSLLARSTWRDPSRSVRGFVYTTIKNIAEADRAECEIQQRIASHVLTLTKQACPSTILSSHAQHRLVFDDVMVQLSRTLFSNLESTFPRHVASLLKANLGGISMDLYEFDMTIEGMHKLFDMMGGKTSESPDPKDVGARIAQNLYEKVIEQVYESKKDAPRGRSQQELGAHIHLKIMDNIQFVLPLTSHSIENDDGIDIATLILELSFGKEVLWNKFSPLMFLAYAVPSDLGLPLVSEHSSVLGMHEKLFATLSVSMDKLMSGVPPYDLDIEDDVRGQHSYKTRISTYAPWDMKVVSTAVISTQSLTLPWVGKLSGHPGSDKTMLHKMEFSRLYPDQNMTIASKSVVPATFLFTSPMSSEQFGANIMIPIIHDYQEESWCGGEKFAGVNICIKKTTDGNQNAKTRFFQDDGFKNTCRFRSLQLIDHPDKSVTKKMTISAYFILSGKKDDLQDDSNSGAQYSQYDQYDQYDQSSSNDYSEKFDDQDVEAVDGFYQITDSVSDRLAKLEKSHHKGIHISAKLSFEGGPKDLTYEAMFSSSKQKLHKIRQEKYQIVLMSHLLSDSICWDISRNSPHISSMDTLEELVQTSDIIGVIHSVVGVCGKKPNVDVELTGTMTKKRMKHLYEDILTHCHNEYNTIALFKQKASYDEGKLSITLQDIPQSMLDQLSSFIGGPISPIIKDCTNFISKDKTEINVIAQSQPPHYENYDLELFYNGESQRKAKSVLPTLPMQFLNYKKSKRNMCVIKNDRVRLFDGLVEYYTPSSCWAIAAQDCSRQDGWVVLTMEDGSKGPPHVRIISPPDSLVVEMTPGEVKANGKVINPIGDKEMIKNKSGKILGIVKKTEDAWKVIIMDKLGVMLKDRVEISVTESMKNRLCGICGNMDGEINFADFTGPQNCFYNDYDTLVASWSAESDECDVWALLERRNPATEFQGSCTKVPSSTYMPSPQQQGFSQVLSTNISEIRWVYPIEEHAHHGGDPNVCVGHHAVPLDVVEHHHYQSDQVKERNYRCWSKKDLPDVVRNEMANGYIAHPHNFHSGYNQLITTRLF